MKTSYREREREMDREGIAHGSTCQLVHAVTSNYAVTVFLVHSSTAFIVVTYILVTRGAIAASASPPATI